MIRVLACPFGSVNLLTSLLELLRTRMPRKYDITYLSFTEYDRAIYRRLGASHAHIAPGEARAFLPDEVLDELIHFTRELGRINRGVDFSGTLRSAANHYARRLDEHLESEAYDDVVLFNGRMNLFITVLDFLVDRAGLRKLVFEQGLFRPGYLTIDGRGVNRRNSVVSLSALLSPEPFPYQLTDLYQDLVGLLPLPESEIVDFKRHVPKRSLITAYLTMKLQARSRIFLRDADDRDLLEAGLGRGRRPAPRTNILDSILAPNRYRHVILCPFQVETDTQVVLHSPWIRNMADFVTVIGEALQVYNSGRAEKACAVFKIHPMHPLQEEVQHRNAFLINESTVQDILRRRCDLVITLNSTVGIEAIEVGCPVITLGDAFYSFPGVISAECKDPAALPDLIARALHHSTVERDLQRRFIDALKTKYQVRLRP